MSLKSRLLNRNLKIQSISTHKAYEPLSCNIDILSYFENNPEVSALYIYASDKIYVEKNNVLAKSEIFLPDDNAIKDIIQSIADKYELIINAHNPYLNINLSNGIKINAIIPPMANNKHFLSIKRITKPEKNIDSLIFDKVLSNEMVLYLKECINKNLNIFVCGSAYTSKLSVLNAISNMISPKESIVTIETSPQLYIKNDCTLPLISYKPFFNKILKKAVNLKHNRIIIPDMDTSELLKIFEYVNTGYSGFLVSFSSRMYEDMVTSVQNAIALEHPNFSLENASHLIHSSIDVVVYIDKMPDGTQRITHIGEFLPEKDTIKLKDIFAWKSYKTKNKGCHYSTGLVSKYFSQDTLFPSALIEKHFTKEYKHNYIVEKSKISLKDKIRNEKEIKDSNIKKRIRNYKTLENEIRNIVTKRPLK